MNPCSLCKKPVCPVPALCQSLLNWFPKLEKPVKPVNVEEYLIIEVSKIINIFIHIENTFLVSFTIF